MRITIREGKTEVSWNDRGDPNDPPALVVEGLRYPVSDEQTLRDLHECLDFLFSRPK